MQKIKCPHCGYEMPIMRGDNAVSRDLWIKCKGRGCGRIFEIVIKEAGSAIVPKPLI